MKANINEIREALERWYAGESTPAEQHRLEQFFAEATELPDDLQAERELFMAMSEAEQTAVPMPEEYTARMDAALAEEMAAERKRGVWRRWRIGLTAVASAAACFLLVFTAWNIKLDETPEQMQSVATLAEKVAVPGVESETPVAVKEEAPKAALAEQKVSKRAKRLPVSNGSTGVKAAESSSYDEEERIASANYRVVTEENADEIINKIFCRLDSRMAEGTSCVDAVCDDYNVKLASLNY